MSHIETSRESKLFETLLLRVSNHSFSLLLFSPWDSPSQGVFLLKIIDLILNDLEK